MESGKDKNLILLVDDEPDLLESCVRILEDEGYACIGTTNSTEVPELVRRHAPSVIITDYLMPGKTGMDILKEVRPEFPDTQIIMISAYATIDGVVDAVKSGAFDYLTKPFSSDQLAITVRRVFDHIKLQKENSSLKKRLRDDYFNHFFVGKHPMFLKTVELIRKIAGTESNVLVTGESGTGKELAARAIHMHSKRADKPFIVADCTTLTKEMTEAAPLGAEDGRGHKSIFEAAEGGTLYLEHVGELDPILQARFIRILQDRRVPRGGGEWDWVPVDVRIIASTTSDLNEAIADKSFRENLYYCLNVVNITIPPLRERREDIGILSDNFLRKVAEMNGQSQSSLHPDALEKLMDYDWPGNVRQLKNLVERMVSMAEDSVIMVANLPDEIRYYSSHSGVSYKEARRKWLQKFEKHYLENLLLTNKGNILRASEMAGIARMSLYRMLKRTGLHELVLQERSVEKSKPNQPPADEF